MLQKVDRILLRVPQLESAVRYYQEVLGLGLVRQNPTIANFRLPDCETELVLHTDADLPAEATYFLVADVRDLYRRREALRLKFTAPPAAVSRGYRAAVKDPFGNVLLLLDRTTDSGAGAGGGGAAGTAGGAGGAGHAGAGGAGGAGHAGAGGAGPGGAGRIEDAKSPGALFAGVESKIPAKRDALARIYEKLGRTADDLPYTPHFETLYRAYVAALHTDAEPTRREVWRHLLNLRKGGKLPRVGEARSKPPKLAPEHEAHLRELLGADIGKRDRLPYTDRFDDLVNDFNQTQPRRLSPHLVWRVVAKLAK